MNSMIGREMTIVQLKNKNKDLIANLKRIHLKVLPLYEVSKGRYLGAFKKLRDKMEKHKQIMVKEMQVKDEVSFLYIILHLCVVEVNH